MEQDVEAFAVGGVELGPEACGNLVRSWEDLGAADEHDGVVGAGDAELEAAAVGRVDGRAQIGAVQFDQGCTHGRVQLGKQVGSHGVCLSSVGGGSVLAGPGGGCRIGRGVVG
ncbi:hypothetical protein ACFVYP_39860 [Kitasatospora sp. NPDC058201]|uniref:hypothetical protein n=1 Tax=unclassified Kitasatospora TaxID=2633591 RepID=UPI003667F51C